VHPQWPLYSCRVTRRREAACAGVQLRQTLQQLGQGGIESWHAATIGCARLECWRWRRHALVQYLHLPRSSASSQATTETPPSCMWWGEGRHGASVASRAVPHLCIALSGPQHPHEAATCSHLPHRKWSPQPIAVHAFTPAAVDFACRPSQRLGTIPPTHNRNTRHQRRGSGIPDRRLRDVIGYTASPHATNSRKGLKTAVMQ
jgi:hypothetical protein